MIRLDKMLSHLGYGSRKEVKEIIRHGWVYVNGEQIKDDDFKVSEVDDEIIVDGDKIDYEEYIYIMLNKPQGVISATYDPRYETVIDLIPEYRKMNIFPVGRLDIDTEGLLIITNDGELAHKLLSPKYHVFKKYYVEFSGTFKEEYYKSFESGIILDDGYETLPGKIEVIDDNKAHVYIREGKYHQVKRMFEALDMHVDYLKRIAFGDINLDKNLKLGEWRMLENDELNSLKSSVK